LGVRRIRRHVSTFPNRWQAEDSNSDDASWDNPPTRSCDPYLEPGFLTTNPYDIAGTFWTPYDETCPRAPSFLQDVRDRKPLPWLDGRTLLLIGDSIERNNVRYFCELVGSNDLRTTPMRNLSATLREGNTVAEPADITRPRVCRVEEYDFEIVSFFHYGMQDEDIWSDTRIFTPPALMEERIGTVFDLFLESDRDFPDMVILASGTPPFSLWGTGN
jgi:hypothetical protein